MLSSESEYHKMGFLLEERRGEKIASVNRHGKIKARSKGKCYVYAYAQNGAGKKVLVIVK